MGEIIEGVVYVVIQMKLNVTSRVNRLCLEHIPCLSRIPFTLVFVAFVIFLVEASNPYDLFPPATF
jgi:hypothetical protein